MYATGQIIKASVNDLPLIYHYGIVLIDGEQIYVLHNSPDNVHMIDTLDNYLESREIIEIRNTHLNNLPINYILNRFNEDCKQTYHVINYNCEHFIDCMLNEQHQSEQLVGWFMAFGIGAWFYWNGL
jgi:hypothetical protein